MRKTAALLLSLIFLFSATSPIFAAEFKPDPESFFIQATAGQTIHETVLIKNLSPTTKTLQLAWQSYSFPEGQFTSREALAKHSINFAALNQTNLELQPFEVTPTEMEFKIPKNIVPADYYGSLSVSDQSSRTQTEFTIRILGKIEEKVDITGFLFNGSSLIIYLANNGNQTVDVKANIKIQTLFGQTSNLAPINQSLKATQQKTLEVEQSKLLPGYYQAKVSLEYGSGRTKSSFYSFWIRPEFFLIVGFLVFIVVLSAILAKRKARR